jgi:hypothetical protein
LQHFYLRTLFCKCFIIKIWFRSSDFREINFSYFQEKDFIGISDALKKIEEYLDFKEEASFDYHKENKPSILRSVIPFILQNQDTIKDKRNLFYPLPVKNHFPILAGWINQKYYDLQEQLKYYDKKIASYGNIQEIQNERNRVISNFHYAFEDFYMLMNLDYNKNWSLKTLVDKVNDFPNFKNPENISNNTFKNFSIVDNKVNELIVEKSNLSVRLTSLTDNQTYSQQYSTHLRNSKQRIDYDSLKDNYLCPICNNISWETNLEILKIKQAEKDLQNELRSIAKTNIDFTNEINDIRAKIKLLDNEIKDLNKRKNDIINQNKELNEFKNLEKLQLKAQTKVELLADNINLFLKQPLQFDDYERDIRQRNAIKEQLKEYTFTEEYKDATKEIKEKMETVVAMLDFEYNPPDLHFELNPVNTLAYKLYHNDKAKGRMFLNQIGSASNALACHIGMFISFLYYFASEKNSKVPSILFLDQPSQVYFPTLENGVEDNDTLRVKEIYETLETWIDTIESETKIRPQIIVADHIKNLGNYTKNIHKYFVAEWRDGKKFI